MVSKAVWIHVGLAKTGTSSLQRTVFALHPQINYLGKNWIGNERAKAALLKLARGPERGFSLDESRAIFSQMLSAAELPGSAKRVSLLSEEDFTTFRFLNPEICASRLRKIFPDASILLVVREPVEWLRSMYFFRLSLRFSETLDGFNAWLRWSLDRKTIGTDIGQIQMGHLAKIYASHFRADKMCVARYEDFAADEVRFIQAICDMLNIDAGVAIDLYRTGEHRKARITERHLRFLLKYKLVIQGRYDQYMTEVMPLLGVLGKRAAAQARNLLPTDLAGDPRSIEQRLRSFSVFVDRAGRSYFMEGDKATAKIDSELENRVKSISASGLGFVASEFNPGVRSYLSQNDALGV